MTVSEYVASVSQEQKELLFALCQIPAPSHHEEKRAEFCRKWLVDAGFSPVSIDSAKNVIASYGKGEEIVLCMAHTDTVFPETDPLPQRIEENRFYSPGAGDDTANLVNLMLAARYIRSLPEPKDFRFLFVCNSCEEGLGNLKGSRQIVEDYGEHIRTFYSLDGYLGGACSHAVGSHRYRVTAKTIGGHSYGSFGNPNAIAVLAQLITEIYRISVPDKGKTTYNVGEIYGGTSVNTIAQEAGMLFEYRSDNQDGLSVMKKKFFSLLEQIDPNKATVSVELLGERPGMPKTVPEAQGRLDAHFIKQYRELFSISPAFHPGSTDCNIPLSQGIPALCFGTVSGGGAHTYGEWVDMESLPNGLTLVLNLLLSYLG